MTQAERIIGKFGGLTALSRELGHRHCTTVQGWKERGLIPTQYHLPIIEKAREHGIDLTPADFFPELFEAGE